MKTLFLDFDGVLHPASVFIDGGVVKLDCEDKSLFLFCWAPILEHILDDEDPHGVVKIILSTTWGHRFGWKVAATHLTEGLRARVVGGTTGYSKPRGRQIEVHAEDVRIADEDWIAIDDDDYWWPEKHLGKLVRSDPELGLLSKETQEDLRRKLRKLLNGK